MVINKSRTHTHTHTHALSEIGWFQESPRSLQTVGNNSWKQKDKSHGNLHGKNNYTRGQIPSSPRWSYDCPFPSKVKDSANLIFIRINNRTHRKKKFPTCTKCRESMLLNDSICYMFEIVCIDKDLENRHREGEREREKERKKEWKSERESELI